MKDERAWPRLLPAGLPDARESDDAGRYYCAHALFLGHVAVERGLAPVALDDEGDPLVGFLHVPPDEGTLGGVPSSLGDRHRDTKRVLAAALAGWAAALSDAGWDDPVNVVVTGFGSFRDVVDNPTGDFVRSREDVCETLGLAFPDALPSVANDADGTVRATLTVEAGRKQLRFCFAGLPVDDRCLAEDGDESLLALLAREGAHAWIGLGVCRSPFYRVETLPHDGGLQLDDGVLRHDREREPRRFPRGSRSLVRALERGGPVVAARVSRRAQQAAAAETPVRHR